MERGTGSHTQAPPFRRRAVAPCYSWLLVSYALSSPNPAPPLLFNLTTSEIIPLPLLKGVETPVIKRFLLSSPPTDPEYRVFLFYRKRYVLMPLSYSGIAFCKLGDKLWALHDHISDLRRIDPTNYGGYPIVFTSFGAFQGKLYAKATAVPHTVVISVNLLEFSRLEVNDVDFPLSRSLERVRTWIGESLGELLPVPLESQS